MSRPVPQENLSICPSLTELEAHLSHPSPHNRYAAHITGCAACRDQIEQMRQNEALLVQLRSSDGLLLNHAPAGLPPIQGSASWHIEGYEIIGELSRGGQGVVFKALQRATNRVVALKVLGAGAFATSRQRSRFEREIDLVASLRHPAIVTVHDSGVTDDDRAWFAMEHIAGPSLDEYLRGRLEARVANQISLRDVLELFAAICDGVSHAHQHGVIHRDLKPSNILVDAESQPHVLDFGLARPVDPHVGGGQATVTAAGQFMGTIAYASPEQTLGDPNLIDVRTDVYSLGVILHEMLTGTYPYPVTGQLSDVLATIATAPPRAPSVSRPMRFRLDDELDTIALKALAKDRERRYQSAGALRQDIEHYLAGEAIDAKRDSGWYLFKKALMRHKVRAAVASSFVIVLVVFGIAMAVLYQRARIEAEKVRQINIFLEDTLGSVEAPSPEQEVTVRNMLDEAVHWVQITLADEPEVEASVRMAIGNGYRNLGHYDQAQQQLLGALETRRTLFSDGDLQVAQSVNALGLLRRDQGRLDEAEALIREALQIRRAALGHHHLEVSMSLSNLAGVMQHSNRLDEAEDLMRQSLAIRRELLGGNHPDVAMTLFGLATVRELQADYAVAAELHAQSLAIRDATLHPDHPDLIRSQLALGRCLRSLQRYEESESRLIAAFEAARRTWGRRHRHTLETVEQLVALYGAWGRPDRAAEYRAMLERSQ